MKRSELLLHPVRMRIVQRLLGGRELTTADLRREIDDVPPATLYRHVSALLDGGALEVAEERQVRGAVERTYRVRPDRTTVGPEDARQMTRDEHAAAFLAFMTGRLADFERYLDRAGTAPDLAGDRVGYRLAALNLTDEETDELLAKMREIVLPLLDNEPGPGRRRRLLSTILLPDER